MHTDDLYATRVSCHAVRYQARNYNETRAVSVALANESWFGPAMAGQNNVLGLHVVSIWYVCSFSSEENPQANMVSGTRQRPGSATFLTHSAISLVSADYLNSSDPDVSRKYLQRASVELSFRSYHRSRVLTSFSMLTLTPARSYQVSHSHAE